MTKLNPEAADAVMQSTIATLSESPYQAALEDYVRRTGAALPGGPSLPEPMLKAANQLVSEVEKIVLREYMDRLYAMTCRLTGERPANIFDGVPEGGSILALMESAVRSCEKTLQAYGANGSRERPLHTALRELADCAGVFEHYAALHLTKSPPSIDKALENANMAKRCRDVIKELSPQTPTT